jgi:hypothetical protein
MKRAPGRAGIIMWRTPRWLTCSWCGCNSCSKKVPALTIPQARCLIGQALADEHGRPDPLALLVYRQNGNRAAYRSHRKRTRERLRRPAKRRNLKVS